MKLTLLSVVGMASLAFATPTVKRGQPATYGGSGMGGGNNGGGMGGGEGGNSNGGGNGGSGGQSGGPVCAGSATPLCCATDVLGVAALTCSDPSGMPSSQKEFLSTCAMDGRTAQCCTISAGSLALLCEDVA